MKRELSNKEMLLPPWSMSVAEQSLDGILTPDIKRSSSEMLYAGEHAREMIMSAFPGAVL